MNNHFEKKNEICDNVELIDLSYNLFEEINLINNNLQKLNLSFNPLRNLNNTTKELKKLKSLRELNLIENAFNRSFYNLEVVHN